MCPPQQEGGNHILLRFNEMRRTRKTSGRGGKEFVTLDAGGNSGGSFALIHAQDAGVAADVNVAGKGDLLRQGENEFDGAARFNNRFHNEIQSAETYVARFSLFFEDAAVCREAHFHGQVHRKSARGATLYI